MYPHFYLFGHKIMSFDVMLHLSFIAVGIYLYRALTSVPLKKSQVLIFLVIGYPVQFFGGKILPFLYYSLIGPHKFVYQAEWWFMRLNGRFFHSVVLSLLVYTVLFCKFFRWPTRRVLDRYVIGILLASVIGRVGCLLQGCCAGKPCDLPWAIHLPPNLEVGKHPSQAYMIIGETALIFFLWLFIKKQRYDGQTFWLASLLYSVYRFLVEFSRVNPVAYFGLTAAQLFSISTFALSVMVLSYYRVNPPKEYGK